jgi:hypothetical protein
MNRSDIAGEVISRLFIFVAPPVFKGGRENQKDFFFAGPLEV